MSHIPGFPLGAMGPSNPQQAQTNIPSNLHLFNAQQQPPFLTQHPQHQQRQQQSSPHQSQAIPGVNDPEHQRMWQAMDQHVRAHNNDATQGNPAFNQMADFLRVGAASHPQHNQQQQRLPMQGFPPQMQPQAQNANTNLGPNPMAHGLNPNSNTAPFNLNATLGGVPPPMTAAQLQALADRNPAVRAALLQQQQQRQQQHQQIQQQQQAGIIGSQFGLGPNVPGPSPNQTQHPMTPANVAAQASANTAELSRQLQLMSRAGQNQAQSTSNMNQGSPGLHSNRPQQPSQPAQQQVQTSQFQHQIPNGGQIPPGSMQLGPHATQQSIPSGGQPPHVNRQAFGGIPSQFSGTGSNFTGSLIGGAHPPPAHPQASQPNQQPSQPPQVQMRPPDRQRLDQQIALLQQQLRALEAQLRSTNINPAVPLQMTEEQRALFQDLQNKKAIYMKLTNFRQQMDKIQQQNLAGSPSSGAQGGTNGGDGINLIQHSTPVNPGQNISQAQLVQNWLQHNVHNQKTNPPVSQPAGRPQSQAQPPPQAPAPPLPFQQQQQQQQQQLAQLQMQQAQAMQRSGSAQQHPTPAQMMQRPQIGTPQQSTQPPLPQQQGLRTGQIFPGENGQQAATHRPPTAPPPQQQQQHPQQPRPQTVNGVTVMERSRFEPSLKQFLAKQGVVLEPRMLIVDTKEISLYDLHLEVLKKGGSIAVSQHNLWPEVGANLGFVQFPPNGTEPGKPSPQVASHLATVYKMYLSHFESFYIARLTQERRRAAAAAGLPVQPAPPAPTGNISQQQPQTPQQQLPRPQATTTYPFLQNQGLPPQQQPPELQQPNQQPPQPTSHLGFLRGLPPATYARFAHMSAEEMRKQGLPEQSIQIIEAHRPLLQRQLEQQQQQHMRAVGAQPATGPMTGRPPNSISPTPPISTSQQMHPQAQQDVMPGQSNLQASPQPPPPQQSGQNGTTLPATHGLQMIPQGNNVSAHANGPFTRPTLHQMNAAMRFIRAAEEEFSNKRRTYHVVQVPEHEKGSYMSQFDQLWRFVQEVEKKLIMYHALFGDEQGTQKLVAIIVTTKEQRKLLATPAAPPQYILTFPLVRQLLIELQAIMDRFYKAIATMAPGPQSVQNQTGPLQADPMPSTGPPVVDGQSQAPAPPQLPAQHSPSIAPRAGPPANQQLAKTAKRPNSGAVSTPSPSAQTPAAAAHTPPAANAGSPRTPKSPPKKMAPKPKPLPKRRTSKASQQPPAEVKSAGTKRPREDELPTQGTTLQADSTIAEPSPKRVKREEWEGPPSEEMEKRQQEMESIQTNQDVQGFLTRATEDFLVSGNENNTDGPSDGLPQALHDLFKGVPMFDMPDAFPVTTSSDPAPTASASSPKSSDNTFDFLDILDLSQCLPDEPAASSSKLDTPDLVHGSSTNPSPESVAETPKGEHAVTSSSKAKDVKIADDFGGTNPLAPGVWGQINGGEPAFYKHPGWDYEGEMSVLESPWAISSAGT